MNTDEGFADAVARIPQAETVVVADAPRSSEEFARAVRDFCHRIDRSTRRH